MRIIAGSARSLPLKTIEGMDTRPTTDKIKETLFNMLQPDIPGSYFLDLFAGSGQIGLEAVSRGAQYAVFVENARKAAKCIEENIRFTKFDQNTRLVQSDVILALRSMEGRYRFDVIFMDPPYNKNLEREVLEYLKGSGLVKENTLIIVEASLNTQFDYVEELGFELIKYKKYKTNVHIFLRRRKDEAL